MPNKRIKLEHNQSIISDYSTPTTTRSILTPKSTRSRKPRSARAPQLIYRPLELDNESSSESTDYIIRRGYRKRETFEQETPLAIMPPTKCSIEPLEVPTQNLSLVTPKTKPKVIPETPKIVDNSKKPRRVNQLAPIMVITLDDSEDSADRVNESDEIGNERIELGDNDQIASNNDSQAKNQVLTESQRDKTSAEMVEASQCITPPITPEKVKEEEIKLPSFIPGNCNIDEVLKMYRAVTRASVESIPQDVKDSDAG